MSGKGKSPKGKSPKEKGAKSPNAKSLNAKSPKGKAPSVGSNSHIFFILEGIHSFLLQSGHLLKDMALKGTFINACNCLVFVYSHISRSLFSTENERLERVAQNPTKSMTTQAQMGKHKKSEKQIQIDQEALAKNVNKYKSAQESKANKKRDTKTVSYPPCFAPFVVAAKKRLPGAEQDLRQLVKEFRKQETEKVPLDKMVLFFNFLNFYICIFFSYHST